MTEGEVTPREGEDAPLEPVRGVTPDGEAPPGRYESRPPSPGEG